MYTHKELAVIWINYNNQKVTDKRIAQTMRTPFDLLVYMLKQRNLIN
jgi:hypothetical protein